MELTPEQLLAATNMPLTDLRTLILTEEDQKDNPSPVVEDVPEAVAEEDASAPTIYRREIPNGDGSVDVYEADSLEELVEQMAVGKENANKKIQEFIKEGKERKAKEHQVSADEEYVIAERLKKEPKKALREIVNEVIEGRLAHAKAEEEAQTRFVAGHPDYIPNPANGNRMTAWLQLHGLNDCTSDGLEKAYQDLKASGLLALKSEGTDVPPVITPTATQTADADASVQKGQSVRRGSTISTRSVRAVVPVNAQPTLDEAYKMPMDKLRELANAQLAKGDE